MSAEEVGQAAARAEEAAWRRALASDHEYETRADELRRHAREARAEQGFFTHTDPC